MAGIGKDRDGRDTVASLPGRGPLRHYYDGPRLSRVQSVADLRARAHKLIPRFVLEYLEGGAGEEASLERDRNAFADWRFVPRMLRDVSHRSARGRILGKAERLPLAIAPTVLNGLFARHADLALARGCEVRRSLHPKHNVERDDGRRRRDPQAAALVAALCLRRLGNLAVAGGSRRSLRLRGSGADGQSQVYGMREWDARQRIGRRLPSPSAVTDAALHPRWQPR